MKKVRLILYAIFFSARFNILPIHSMENHAQFAAQAKKYNADECLLCKLPNEILFDFFSQRLSDNKLSISSLHNDVKLLTPLSATCKHFNRLITLETIGHLYKKNLKKSKVLKEVIRQLYTSDKNKWLPILAQVLVHAGGDVKAIPQETSALEIAIRKNEEKLIATLLKYNADPNVISMWYPNNPIFFMAATTEIAQILMNSGKVNISATDCRNYNVLHYMLNSHYSPELMSFYLKHNVDATKLYSHGRYILHELAWALFIHAPDNKSPIDLNIENILEKGKILLSVIPHMVNALTTEGKTPIDSAQDAFDIKKHTKSFGRPSKRNVLLFIKLEKLITLFRDHGGLTAHELAQKKSSSSQIFCKK